ncbi:MAG: adenylyl-sulfate kinase [Deltaproteobacteria bacterium]|nr:adenylyl-sulfate kinase [Deltaproteobacteria bacterium]
MVQNLFWTDGLVTQEEREQRLKQKGVTIWLTGLSASGKSTIARTLERKLFDLGYLTFVLDGDNIRRGLNSNLGFSPEDRSENIRRIAELANLFSMAGIINVAAFISPYRRERNLARQLAGNGNFAEVYVNCPLEVCIQRDPKELYKRALRGEIKNFTGIDAPYEAPEQPDLVIKTDIESAGECVNNILRYLREKQFIK